MIEDIAKITEARGIQPGSPSVDVIVWVAKDVPHAVYLDETYAFRVSLYPSGVNAKTDVYLLFAQILMNVS